jgi:hypothetical protein
MRTKGFVRTFVAAILALASMSFAEDIPVHTIKGESVSLRQFRAVHFPELPNAREIEARKDSEGNPRYQMLAQPKPAIVEDIIPLKVGHGFGFDFQCPTIADGDELVLDAEIQLPATNQVISTKYRYTARNTGKYTFIVWGLRADHSEYLLAGTWQIRIRNQGKEVISHSFQVIGKGAANKSVEPTPTR